MLTKQQAASGEQALLDLDHLDVEGVSDVVCCICKQPATSLEELRRPETAGTVFAFCSTALLM